MKDLMFSRGLRNNPFYFLEDIENDMKRMLNHFPMRKEEDRSFTPLYDMQDNDSHYVLNFDLPGVKKEDINIEIKEGVLHLSGKRDDKVHKGSYTERTHGHFERTIPLPQGIKEEEIKARYENGVLSLALPKMETPKAKKITIEEGKKDGIWADLLKREKNSESAKTNVTEKMEGQTA